MSKKIDKDTLYFHGSSEARVDRLQAPSFEHPFYVTSDLHYAMAFCTKSQSMTGDWTDRELSFRPANENYVYVVTLNPSMKVFDFRDQRSFEFKRAFGDIIDPELIKWMNSDSNLDTAHDIYEFCVVLDSLFANLERTKFSWLEYSKTIGASSTHPLTPKLYLKACDVVKKLNLDRDSLYKLDIHGIMAPILRHLSKKGYHAVRTSERDANEEMKFKHERHEVTTNDAIGVFDVNGLDLLCLVPMKYAYLKKINPRYLEDTTSEDAKAKVRRFVAIYRRIIEKSRASKQDMLEESQTPLVQAFIDEFGEDVVLGNDEATAVQTTPELVKKIYDAVNRIAFRSTLKPVDIVVSSRDRSAIASYSFMFRRVDGFPVLIDRSYKTKSGSTVYAPQLQLYKWIFGPKIPFMMLASVVAHEMIHQYDIENGTELAEMIMDEDEGIPHDTHGQSFTRMMNWLNKKHGLAVTKKFTLSNMDAKLKASLLAAWDKMNESDEDISSTSSDDVKMKRVSNDIVAVKMI